MTHASLGVALVTGASRGIGAAIALRLARDGRVVAVHTHPDPAMITLAEGVARQVRSDGGQAVVLPADLSHADDVAGMFDQCATELGAVGALVLNAAAASHTPWNEVSCAEWDHLMAVNLRSGLLCCQHAFANGHHPGAAIVTISSVLARTGAPSSLPYVTSKAGLLGFTRSLARELGPAGIRVNSVLPGAIRTEHEAEITPDSADADRDVLARQTLQRRGEPSDIANAVSFLLGPDSSFITGQTLCVDGGWLLH